MTKGRRKVAMAKKRHRRLRTKPGLVVLSPEGERRQLRRPSRAELEALLYEISAYAGQIPRALWNQMRELLVRLIAEDRLDMRAVDRFRGQIVFEEMERVGYENSFASAAEKLANSPFAGGEDAMRKSYQRYRRSLSPEQRRRRSYRRRH
jgi:hypothetical protein